MEVVAIENAVIGAGVIGLAIGAELSRRGHISFIFDSEATFGSGISSRNSEVIHSGIYYPNNSLKSRFCLEGAELLYAYCEANRIAHRKCGKLVIASSQQEEEKLEAILRNAQSCGINNISTLGSDEVRSLEPNLKAFAALHVSETGIIDSHQFMGSLAREVEEVGGRLLLRHRVESFRCDSRGFEILISTPNGELLVNSTRLILAAGLFTHELIFNCDGCATLDVPQLSLAKGDYFSFTGRSNFSRLIYPVPEDGGLGVHLTFDLSGQVRFGPDVEWLQTNNPNALDYSVDNSKSKLFYEAIRKYWPNIPEGSLVPAYAGVRPKLSNKGSQPADFAVRLPVDHNLPGLAVLFGIESPGLTSSLALAKYVVSGLMH